MQKKTKAKDQTRRKTFGFDCKDIKHGTWLSKGCNKFTGTWKCLNLDVPVEETVHLNHEQWYSMIESAVKQAGPSHWLSLEICKRTGLGSSHAARLLLLHAPSALHSSLHREVGLCPQSGFREEERGQAGEGAASLHWSRIDRNLCCFLPTHPFFLPLTSPFSKQHHSFLTRRGSIQRCCDGTSGLLGPGQRPTQTKCHV